MISWGSTHPAKFFVRRINDQYSYIGSPSEFLGYKVASRTSPHEDGIWAEWRWHQEQIELRNDRYGMFPLYIYNTSDTFGVSTHIEDLLQNGAPVELDDAAISVFLRLGFFIGNDTPFLKIRAIPPGSRLTWNKGNLYIKSKGSHYGSGYNHLSKKDAMHAYGELFHSVIQSYLPKDNYKICLPLSGGRDSRHILFALIQNQHKPDCCVTVNRDSASNPSLDVEIAALVAERFQIPHLILEHPTNLMQAVLQKNLHTSFCTDEHTWVFSLRDHLRENNYQVLLDGIGGDVLSAGLFLNSNRLELLSSGRLWELANDILGTEGNLPKMLSPSYYRRWNRDLALQHLIPELSKYLDSPNPIGQFFFWNRTRREIALGPWNILLGPCHVIAPYLATEVYDFLSALPAAYFSNHEFHVDAINNYYPEYTHLPYAKRRNPSPRNRMTTRAGFILNLARYIFPIPGSNNPINYWSFLAPRLIKGIIFQEYGSRLHKNYQIPIYLTQLLNTLADYK